MNFDDYNTAREETRLERLRRYLILDSAPETAYDDITRAAKNLFDVPLVAVNFLDSDRDWFKSKIGTDSLQSPRSTSFCIQMLLQPDAVLVSEDTTHDQRFAAHPLVVGPPHFRFYVAAPIRTPDGLVMGTVCAYDFQPRKVAESQIKTLADLASAVTVLLEKRPKG